MSKTFMINAYKLSAQTDRLDALIAGRPDEDELMKLLGMLKTILLNVRTKNVVLTLKPKGINE